MNQISKEDIYSSVLNLSPMEKAKLVEVILSSFNLDGIKNVDAKWADEAERRYDAVKSGKLKLVSADDVFKSINI